MKNRALLSAIALCFAAAACDSQKAAEPPKPKAQAAVVPLPPEAPKAAAASANQDAKPMQVADAKADSKKKAGAPAGAKRATRPGTKGCGNDKCKVNIKDITPGKPHCTATYNARDLDVAGQDVEITFHATGGWVFDKNGIDLPIGGGQFSNPQGEGTNKYSVVDKNDDTTKYKYNIRLVKGGQRCLLDPSIANGAETIDPNYPPFP